MYYYRSTKWEAGPYKRYDTLDQLKEYRDHKGDDFY